MRWNQSDQKVLTIITIVGVLLYAVYKGLQFLAGLTMGASFGAGLGGMGGSQYTEESRKVETDAPTQIIYRIDKNRYLTLENYISCDKGGQVYYNDSLRGIKTLLGWDIDFNDFSYRLGNSVASYQGSIVNGADNGYLAFPGASTEQYCGSGTSERGCPVFFFFSADYGKTFIYKIVAQEYKTPERFSQLKVVVANDGVYLRDESETEPFNDVYRREYSEIFRVNHYTYTDGKLANIYDERKKFVDDAVKKEISKRGVSYAKEYDSEGFDIYSYAKSRQPPLTNKDINKMVDELRSILSEKEKGFYKEKIMFPRLPVKSWDSHYKCNSKLEAKKITYIKKNGKKNVVNNEG